MFKFYVRRYSIFHWRRNSSYKNVTVEEELEGTDTGGIGNLMDLPNLIFIDQEFGSLKLVVDGG